MQKIIYIYIIVLINKEHLFIQAAFLFKKKINKTIQKRILVKITLYLIIIYILQLNTNCK